MSHHTITELVNWISLMERVVEEDEENLKGAVGSKVIQEYVQRYKVQQKLLTLLSWCISHNNNNNGATDYIDDIFFIYLKIYFLIILPLHSTFLTCICGVKTLLSVFYRASEWISTANSSPWTS